MAERLKDKEDVRLEALFRSAPIEDNGFSERVVSRVRRGIWIRRWTLPLAALTGALIAAKPATQLLRAMTDVLAALSTDVGGMELDSLPQLTMFVFAGTMAGLIVLFLNALED